MSKLEIRRICLNKDMNFSRFFEFQCDSDLGANLRWVGAGANFCRPFCRACFALSNGTLESCKDYEVYDLSPLEVKCNKTYVTT